MGNMQKMRLDFLNHVRVVEYAERQCVSLLEIQGMGKTVIKAFCKVGIQTAEQLLEADPRQLAKDLVVVGGPLGETEEARCKIEVWQSQIAYLIDRRRGQPPEQLPWEDDN